MTEQQIRDIVAKLADIARVLTEADPDEAQIETPQHWYFESVRGPRPTNCA